MLFGAAVTLSDMVERLASVDNCSTLLDSGGALFCRILCEVDADARLDPGNNWEAPQSGKGFEFSKTVDSVALFDAVELCNVVSGIDAPDWSAVTDGGVGMAFVSDESTDDACE